MNAPQIQSRFRVSGMDCAACAAKIDAATRRLPGVVEVTVSVTAATLTVHHAAPDDLDGLAARLAPLGYSIAPLEAGAPRPAAARPDGHDHHGHSHPDDRPTEHAHQGHHHGDDDPHPAHDHDDCRCIPDPAPGAAAAAPAGGLHGHDHAAGDGPWWRTTKAQLTLACGLALVAAFAVGLLVPRRADGAFGVHDLIYVGAMLVGLIPIARRAVAAALIGMPFTIEMLMTVAAVGAVLIGAAEEAAAVVFLFLVGELLEGVAAGRARAGIRALAALVPKTALREEAGGAREVPADTLAVGDGILGRPGGGIPADSSVLSGAGAVDEAPVTGESVPVEKGPGDTVFAGTVNGAAALRISVSAAAQDNTIARVVRLVEEAQEAKAPTERFIDRFSRYYTPAIVAIAALVAVLPPLVAGAAWDEWIYKGLAILLIGCPCALVISTPAAIAAGLSAGARRGLLIKGGAVLEALGNLSVVCFDKTGTLTAGRPQVTDIAGWDRTEAEVLRLAAALETGSSHPLARAILDRAATEGVVVPAADEARALGGAGVEALVEGQALFLGSPRAVADRVGLPEPMAAEVEALQAAGKPVAVLVVAGPPAGALALRDEPRPDAAAGLAALAKRGIATLMLTGDNRRTAEAIGGTPGIPGAGALPPPPRRGGGGGGEAGGGGGGPGGGGAGPG